MRMHAVGVRGIVLEDHANGITDLGPQNRTDNSGGLPLCRPWFKAAKGLVGIFAVQRLAIDTPNAMRAALDKDFRVAIKLHAHHFVDAAGGVVPFDPVPSYVGGAGLRWRGLFWGCRSPYRETDRGKTTK